MLDLSTRSANRDLAVLQDWQQNSVQTARLSDKTWSCRRLGIHCGEPPQARPADFADTRLGFAPVCGNRSVVEVVAARPSVESMWSPCLVEFVGLGGLDALLARTAGHGETRIWKVAVKSS